MYFRCLSVNYVRNSSTCQLNAESERSLGTGSLQIAHSVDYYENECVETPVQCAFSEMQRGAKHKDFLINEYPEKIPTAEHCQRACERATGFTCRSISFNEVTQQCTLSDVDSTKRAVNDNAQAAVGFSYMEKTSCLGTAPTPPRNYHF